MLILDMEMPRECSCCPLLIDCFEKSDAHTIDEFKRNCPIKVNIPQITYKEFIKWALENCCIGGEADDE